MNPDELLIGRLCSGDADAIGDIIKKYHALLCWEAQFLLLEREAAKDVVQETLTKIWQNEDLLRLKEPAALKKFLIVCVRRSCIKENIKYRSRKAIVEKLAMEQEQTVEIEYEGFLERQLADKLVHHLKTAMKDLTPTRRIVITKVFFEKLRRRQIAEEMNITEQSVRKYSQRGLEDLRESMLTRR